jgi:hypothetical protein
MGDLRPPAAFARSSHRPTMSDVVLGEQMYRHSRRDAEREKGGRLPLRIWGAAQPVFVMKMSNSIVTAESTVVNGT